MSPCFFRKILFSAVLLLTALVVTVGFTAHADGFDARNVPVVDFGDDYISFWAGLPTYRFGAGRDHRLQQKERIDLDGDGAKDDSLAYHVFSLDVPYNPHVGYYDHTANNATFYGGSVSYFYNMRRPRWSEGGINIGHNKRDDFNLHSYATGSGEELQSYGLWIWKKEDFLNGGDLYPVTFNDESRLAVYISRYWKGWETGRMLVRDGDQFYLSEATFGGDLHHLAIVHPTQTRWAEYNPEPPHEIAFDPASATFREHTFEDVTAMGWMVDHHTRGNASLWLKFYAVGMDAVVHAPEDETSVHLAMREVPDADGLLMADSEISYRDWERVYDWAVRNQYGMHPGYSFEHDGDMGSMDLLDGSYDATHPVTDITWLDAAVWCNALSELEGRRPVYYAEGDLIQVLRSAYHREEVATAFTRPDIYADFSANGYRLPTLAEFARAVRRADASPETAARRTRPVGGDNGTFSDLLGNVWEYIWIGADGRTFAEGETAVAGGGFVAVKDLPLVNGENPAERHYAIGFRPVREPLGTALPKFSPEEGAEVPLWTFPLEGKPAVVDERPDVEVPMIDIEPGSFQRDDEAVIKLEFPYEIGAKEVSFALWTRVLQWGEAHGYVFDYDGDMGSMDYRPGAFAHRPEEPVTDIGYQNALVWCNALSELKGRTPVYYTDEAKTEVYRKVHPVRLSMLRNRYPDETRAFREFINKRVYSKWEADGYRLPTNEEWEYAARAGVEAEHAFPWGTEWDPDKAWYKGNTQGHTQPVGSLPPNAWGLHDVSGNVNEYVWGAKYDFYDSRNPRGNGRPDMRGGSIRWEDPVAHVANLRVDSSYHVETHGFKTDSAVGMDDTGFRVVRYESGVLPVEPPPYVPETVVEVEGVEALSREALSALDGRVDRGNLARTGELPGTAPLTEPSLGWTFDAGAPIHASPIVVDGVAYVASDAGVLHAVDLRDGSEQWRYNPKEGKLRAAVAVYDGKVFLQTPRRMHAVDAATGEVLWENGQWGGDKVSPLVLPGPLTVRGQQVPGLVFGKNRHQIRGYRIDTGEEVWAYRDSRSVGGSRSMPAYYEGNFWFTTGSPLTTAVGLEHERRMLSYDGGYDSAAFTPACRDGRVYTLGNDRGTGAIAALTADLSRSVPGERNGKNLYRPLWLFAQDHWDARHPEFGSFAADAERVYIGHKDQHLYAVNAADGSLAWKTKLSDAVYGWPTLIGGAVYVGSQDGRVHALDRESGRVLWSFATGGPVDGSVTAANGILYVTSQDGNLYSLK